MTRHLLSPETIELQEHNVLESDNGFLVLGDSEEEAVEVSQTESGLECNCFFFTISGEQECEHILAVSRYLQQTTSEEHDRLTMSQADADTYLSKVAILDARLERNQSSAEAQTARIQLWLEAEVERINRQKEYYLHALDRYMREHGFSTEKLVNGVLKLRVQQPEILINDEQAVLADSRFNRIIPEKITIDKKGLRKHLVSTGEQVQGTEVVMREPKFSYSVYQVDQS